MKKLLLGLAAMLILFPFSAFAGEKGKGECDEKCREYRHGATTGIKPAVPLQVCVLAPYERDGRVQLSLYDAGGKLTRRIQRDFSLKISPVVKFCLGAQWFTAAHRMELCNEAFTSVRVREDIAPARGKASPGKPGELWGCLKGKECPQYVAGAPPKVGK